MIKSVIGVSDGTELKPMTPYIYKDNKWVKIFPKIYLDGWRDIGGTGFLMWNFLEHSGLFYNSTDNILVRNPITVNRFITSDNNTFTVPSVVSQDPVQMKLDIRTFSGKNLIDNQNNRLKDSDNKLLVVEI